MQQKTSYQKLHEKWSKHYETASQSLWTKHKDVLDRFSAKTKQFAAGSLASAILLASPGAGLLGNASHANHIGKPLDKSVFLISELDKILPSVVRPLSEDEEKAITEILSRTFSMDIRWEINGKRLNRSYGYIGAEQHLARYPGDTMATHFDNAQDAKEYWSSGMAPGLGAWGYFSPSASQFSKLDSDREKYYIAVQTFLSPEFNQKVGEYRDFYKYRKMLLVNPNNGKTLVADIADAGPAEWTGKHLGGSPEVMRYLERVDGKQKGAVLYYFIFDPEDKIPLGPVDY